MTIKHILCALDLEDENAKTVAAQARDLAKITGARLTALFVVPGKDTLDEIHVAGSLASMAERSVIEHAENIMRQCIADNFHDADVEGRVAVGVPAREIIAIANETHADIITMGTRGKKGLERMLLGSVAASVVKDARCPVLTIPIGAMSAA